MDFLDRIEEIAELRRVLDSKKTAKFIVVFGRRRLGKSTLLKKILEKSDVYYMASDLVTNIQINMLQDQLAVKYPEIGRGEYQSWEDLLLVLNSLTKSKFTLCLDEFPYMVKHSPELPSLLQRLIDSKGLNYNLIICGSSQRMMQELVLSKAEPLYGRADAIINLQPIPPVWLQEALHLSGRETVEEYSVWGGVPRYWELREEYDNLMEAIAHTMLSTTAVLYDEPKRLFLDDMTATVQSESLMSVIASGANRISEIAARMGRDATALSAPIDRLIQMNYVRREIPFGENPKKSRKGIYRINDPLMDFYYTFIIPNMSFIGRGRKHFVTELIETKFTEYVARHWEHLCREAVSGNALFGKIWDEAGRWWGTVPLPEADKNGKKFREMKLDVVAESIDRKALLVGECKWTNPEIAGVLIEKLMSKAALLPMAQNKEIIPVLFLKEPPKDNFDNTYILLPDDVIRLSHGD